MIGGGGGQIRGSMGRGEHEEGIRGLLSGGKPGQDGGVGTSKPRSESQLCVLIRGY